MHLFFFFCITDYNQLSIIDKVALLQYEILISCCRAFVKTCINYWFTAMHKMFNIESVIFAKAYLINNKYGETYFSIVELHKFIVNSLVVRTIKTQHPRYRTPYHTYTWCDYIKYYKTRDVCYFAILHFLAPSATGTSSFVLANKSWPVMQKSICECTHVFLFKIFDLILFWCTRFCAIYFIKKNIKIPKIQRVLNLKK